METTNREVLDISSDEDGDMGEPSDWLECLLDTIEKADSDEVVVVGEVLGSSVVEDQSSKLKLKLKDDLDDECLILDGDPDKPTEVANDTADGSDDLLVVSEKGQIACRDYPHPRHLCARYPFSTNPHEKFCDLCHCYVCDIQAPCIYWGSGAYITDHCHSNDKEEIWRLRRKAYKHGKVAPLPTQKHPKNTFPPGPPLQNSIPAVALSQPLPNSNTPLHVLSRSNTLPSGPLGRSFGVPSIISQHNHHRPGDTLSRIRLPHHVVSRSTSLSPSASTTVNHSIRKDKVIGGGLGPHFVSPHVNFKRVGSGAATLTKTRSVHGPYGNNYPLYNTYVVQQQQQQQQQQVLPQSQPQPHHSATNYDNIQSRSRVLRVCPGASQQHNNYSTVSYNSVQSTKCQEVSLGACQVGSQSANFGSFVNSQPYSISLQPQVYNQPMVPQPTDNVESYLLDEPGLIVPNQNLTNYELNFLNSAAQSLVSAVEENPELPSTQPTSNPLPAIETVPQCPVTTDLTSANFDLESWIKSLEDAPLECAKETLSSQLGFIPMQSELSEEALWFDFENPQKYI